MSEYKMMKEKVLDCAYRLAEKGFLVGTGGNVSMRADAEDRIAITPHGMDYLSLTEDDICVLDFDLHPVEGTHQPSVETGMHVAIYKNRPDVNAVVHTHQLYASLFSLIGQTIPALTDEQVANLGNKVEVVPYGLSGSIELLNNISAAVVNQCNAFVLQNHGALLLGLDLGMASRNVELLEKAAHLYYLALGTGKEIRLLPPEIESTIFELLASEQRREVRRKKKLRKEAQAGA